jgi:outer membrane scaffolding protein for murein synthesis (MipA/OmpV family)
MGAAMRWTHVLACFALLAAAEADAQTPSPLAEWQYSEGHTLEGLMKEVPKWERTFGMSAEIEPIYTGGTVYGVSGGPSFDIRYYDIAFASTGEGFGVNLIHGEGYRAGFAIAYDLGREHNSNGSLTGLYNIGPAPLSKLFAEYTWFPITVRIAVRHYFGGQGGWVGDISAYTPVAGNDKYFVFIGPSVSIADGDNLSHVFGVDQIESADSGFRYAPFHAAGGLRSATIGISSGYFLSEHWLVESNLDLEELIGSPAHSPITQERVQLGMTLTLAYHY